MTKYDFEVLLKKYMDGDCTNNEFHLVEKWSQKYSDFIEKSEININNNETKAKVWERLKITEELKNTKVYTIKKLITVAASIVLIMSLTFIMKNTQDNKELSGVSIKGLQVLNTTDMPKSIPLQDGSCVILEPKSALTIEDNFGKKDRKVFLSGEAFFDIQKDSLRPFYVHTKNLIAEVLGTSFTVQSEKNIKLSSITVFTGKVKVFQKQDDNIKSVITITPNQKITLPNEKSEMIPSVVDFPKALIPISDKNNAIYNETPISTVISNLEKIYGLSFEVNPRLSNCIFTGDLNELDLFTQLDIICATINADYQKKETGIIINGRGCN